MQQVLLFLFLGQYFKNANFSGGKLILNTNLKTLMATKVSGSTVIYKVRSVTNTGWEERDYTIARAKLAAWLC